MHAKARACENHNFVSFEKQNFHLISHDPSQSKYDFPPSSFYSLFPLILTKYRCIFTLI